MISSPYTVMASFTQSTLDYIRTRIEIDEPQRIVFSAGFEMDGIPHIGTYLVQCAGFVLAQQIQNKYGIQATVKFGALDNSTYAEIRDSQSNHIYQITYGHILTRGVLQKMLERYYVSFFQKMHAATQVDYSISYYGDVQRSPAFRQQFFRTLSFSEQIRRYIAPDNGVARVCIPCPTCFYAEKNAERTRLLDFSNTHATYKCVCNTHGEYTITLLESGQDSAYLDLNVIYRNLIKELVVIAEKDTLYVIVKGGDWLCGTTSVDWALGAMGYFSHQTPIRLFTPQIVTDTGAKLSKTAFREKDETCAGVPTWLLDMEEFAERIDDYADRLIQVMHLFLSDPRHMFRSYSYQEMVRLLEAKSPFTIVLDPLPR